MKTSLFIMVAAISLMFFYCSAADASRVRPLTLSLSPLPAPEIGRFQLFQGEYTTFDLKRKETYTHQGLFLLDSTTGKVKRYINKIDEDGIYIETWVSTDLPLPDKNKTVTAPAKEGKQ